MSRLPQLLVFRIAPVIPAIERNMRCLAVVGFAFRVLKAPRVAINGSLAAKNSRSVSRRSADVLPFAHHDHHMIAATANVGRNVISPNTIMPVLWSRSYRDRRPKFRCVMIAVRIWVRNLLCLSDDKTVEFSLRLWHRYRSPFAGRVNNGNDCSIPAASCARLGWLCLHAGIFRQSFERNVFAANLYGVFGQGCPMGPRYPARLPATDRRIRLAKRFGDRASVA